MRKNDTLPGWAWWGTWGAVIAVLAGALGAALLLAAGLADPPVAPRVTWRDDTLGWLPSRVESLPPGTGHWHPGPPAIMLPTGTNAPFTLEIRARLAADADPGAAWGVWLEMGNGARVVYAVSADGYITTRRCAPPAPAQIDGCPALQPDWRWMPYPRVQPPGSSNVITLHRESDGAIRLRLNGEILGAARLTTGGGWGVWRGGGWDRASELTWEYATLRTGD